MKESNKQFGWVTVKSSVSSQSSQKEGVVYWLFWGAFHKAQAPRHLLVGDFLNWCAAYTAVILSGQLTTSRCHLVQMRAGQTPSSTLLIYCLQARATHQQRIDVDRRDTLFSSLYEQKNNTHSYISLKITCQLTENNTLEYIPSYYATRWLS